jgi:membrane protease YdiL (CAAX protease family)
MGGFIAVLRVKSDSILPSIAAHGVFNILEAFLLVYFFV